MLASGGGRSLENLAEAIERGELDAELALLVSDRADAGVLARAERLGIPHLHVPYRRAEAHAFSAKVFEEARDRGCELIVLAGFLRLLDVPDEWNGRILNIHPSLLPAFGGKGFYGDRVHRAVLDAGVSETGCTVHLIDREYDRGEILLQRRVPVLPGDTVESLGQRVFEEEKLALPQAIERFFSRTTRGR